jgi:hypothetical protein
VRRRRRRIPIGFVDLPHAIQRDIVSTAWWENADEVYHIYYPTPCDDCTRWAAINWYAQQVERNINWDMATDRRCTFCVDFKFQLFMAEIYEYGARAHVWEIEEGSSSDEDTTGNESAPEDVL